MNIFERGIYPKAVSSKNLEVIKTLASQSLTMYQLHLAGSLQLIAVYLSPLRQAANIIERIKMVF